MIGHIRFPINVFQLIHAILYRFQDIITYLPKFIKKPHLGVINRVSTRARQVNLQTKMVVHSFAHYEDMVGPQNLNMGHVTLTATLFGSLLSIGQYFLNLCTKFEVSSCTHAKM